MRPSVREKRTQAQKAREKATREFLAKQDPEARWRIAEFALGLIRTVEKGRGRSIEGGVGRFMAEWIDGHAGEKPEGSDNNAN